MMTRLRTFLLTLVLAPLAVQAVEQAPDCTNPHREVPLDTAMGSVGFIKNMAEDPTSIRAVAGRLLENALGDGTKAVAHDDCIGNCPDKVRSEVVYRVSPTAFLDAAEQHDVCRRYESETTVHPLEFDARSFASVAELNDWIMAFSQGRGADGKLLYERCSSNCSPRYTFLIAEQSSGYAVRAQVLCGLARDKANDQYRISTALRRRCAVN